jgi:hypothetical protein
VRFELQERETDIERIFEWDRGEFGGGRADHQRT